ncbi:TetR/AcrR family transcriptional regulator [Paenibacillus contaminans]|uniref:TetR/AcrR family transcriptional regulator n=1 Tax=Paenibacillus contaminans TaxID=450362 RepID=A0A329MV21_9BACL|nr:TetR/AcrR family transcriptional regulator [Paenibacillus contaminans]RAV22513.1 TetR/AcrR family transcriptional regulator [Paenibacillus contaminans]
MNTKRTDPRVVRTRQLLRKALIELMEERDYDSISVQDIADRATVKRATFYLHFVDKPAFVQKLSDELLEELSAEIIVPFNEEGDTFDFLSGEPHPSFVRLFHHISERFDLYRALLVRNRIPYFADGLLNVIHEFVARGIDYAEPDDRNLSAAREVAVKYVESAFLEVIVWWIRNLMPYSEEEIAGQLMRLSIRGPYQEIPARRRSGPPTTS